LAVPGSAPGKWSVPYHRQKFQRPVKEYHPRDIGRPPEGRERRNNGPWRTSFELSSYLVNSTQVPGTGPVDFFVSLWKVRRWTNAQNLRSLPQRRDAR